MRGRTTDEVMTRGALDLLEAAIVAHDVHDDDTEDLRTMAELALRALLDRSRGDGTYARYDAAMVAAAVRRLRRDRWDDQQDGASQVVQVDATTVAA